MRTSLVFLLVFLLLPKITWAEAEADRLLDDRVPQQMTRSTDGKNAIWNLIGYESYSFRGFSLGKATGLPMEEQNRLVRIISEAKPEQVIFVQGIADEHPWNNRAKSEFRGLDFDVAMLRARWAASKANESYPDISGKIKLLTPAVEHDRRGLNVFVATYEKNKKIDLSSPFSLDIKVGGIVGTSFVSAGHMNFFVPIAGLLIKSGPWEANFFGGWRPANKNKDGLGDRAQSIVGADITFRDGEWFGYSTGFNTAWETLQDHDYKYVDRITGFYTGPKFFVNYNGFDVVFGGNIQVVSLNRFGRDKSWWKTGYGLNLQLQRLFN